jgi:hypothetical protein
MYLIYAFTLWILILHFCGIIFGYFWKLFIHISFAIDIVINYAY